MQCVQSEIASIGQTQEILLGMNLLCTCLQSVATIHNKFKSVREKWAFLVLFCTHAKRLPSHFFSLQMISQSERLRVQERERDVERGSGKNGADNEQSTERIF